MNTNYRIIAEEIVSAEDNLKAIPRISEKYSNFTVDDAYKIQKEVFSIKEERGEKIIGKKIGLTSEGIRNQIGVYEPDFSSITDSNYLNPYETLKLSEQIIPKLEPELAFLMKKDLNARTITNWDVIDAVEGVFPAFEIVDTRYGRYDFTIVDTISDSASYGKIKVGNSMAKLDDLDMETIGLCVYKNGKLFKTAASAEVMGNPINSVVWLANKMLELGSYLKAGDIILSGSFTPIFELAAGDVFEAKFNNVGKVRLEVEE